MRRKPVANMMLTLLLTSMLTFAFRVQRAKSLESPPTELTQAYGGPGSERAYSMIQTSDGGYALAGYTDSYSPYDMDFWLVKTDASGTMQWNRTYGAGGESCRSMIQTSDGGYALAGYTWSYGARGNPDFWLVKTDSSGTLQWSRTYGGFLPELLDFAYSLVQTVDGGYALAGSTIPSGTASFDFWLVKTDSSGTMLWSQTYGGGMDDEAYSLVQTSDGGYAMAGYTNSPGEGGTSAGDFLLVKVNPEVFRVVWDGKTYSVAVSSNSSITEFSFDQPNKLISFNISGLDGTGGFSNVTIPKELLNAAPQDWKVRVNDIEASPTVTWNATHTFIYFTYTHSTKTVQIEGKIVVPEFPTNTILPLFMLLTIVTAIVTKRRPPRKQKTKSPFFLIYLFLLKTSES